MPFNHPLFVFSLGVIVLVVVIVALVKTLRWRPIVVPEGKQVVIYQLGRFNRVDGPGLVNLNQRVDEVVRTINIRNEPDNLRIDGLFSYGLPFGYTLNFWRRTDVKAAAGGDRAKLVQLTLFGDDERRLQVIALLRNTLVATLAQLEREHPQPPDAELLQQLLPILPGIPQCDELLQRLGQALTRVLPAVGVIFDPFQPIVIQSVHLGADIIGSFSRGRKFALLHQQLPGLTNEMLLRAFGVIEGLDGVQLNHMVMESSQPATVELRQTGDRGMEPRVKVRVQEPAHQEPAQGNKTAAAPQPGSADEEVLTPDDLSVLKRVPPVQANQKKTA